MLIKVDMNHNLTIKHMVFDTIKGSDSYYENLDNLKSYENDGYIIAFDESSDVKLVIELSLKLKIVLLKVNNGKPPAMKNHSSESDVKHDYVFKGVYINVKRKKVDFNLLTDDEFEMLSLVEKKNYLTSLWTLDHGLFENIEIKEYLKNSCCLRLHANRLKFKNFVSRNSKQLMNYMENKDVSITRGFIPINDYETMTFFKNEWEEGGYIDCEFLLNDVYMISASTGDNCYTIDVKRCLDSDRELFVEILIDLLNSTSYGRTDQSMIIKTIENIILGHEMFLIDLEIKESVKCNLHKTGLSKDLTLTRMKGLKKWLYFHDNIESNFKSYEEVEELYWKENPKKEAVDKMLEPLINDKYNVDDMKLLNFLDFIITLDIDDFEDVRGILKNWSSISLALWLSKVNRSGQINEYNEKYMDYKNSDCFIFNGNGLFCQIGAYHYTLPDDYSKYFMCTRGCLILNDVSEVNHSLEHISSDLEGFKGLLCVDDSKLIKKKLDIDKLSLMKASNLFDAYELSFSYGACDLKGSVVKGCGSLDDFICTNYEVIKNNSQIDKRDLTLCNRVYCDRTFVKTEMFILNRLAEKNNMSVKLHIMDGPLNMIKESDVVMITLEDPNQLEAILRNIEDINYFKISFGSERLEELFNKVTKKLNIVVEDDDHSKFKFRDFSLIAGSWSNENTEPFIYEESVVISENRTKVESEISSMLEEKVLLDMSLNDVELKEVSEKCINIVFEKKVERAAIDENNLYMSVGDFKIGLINSIRGDFDLSVDYNINLHSMNDYDFKLRFYKSNLNTTSIFNRSIKASIDFKIETMNSLSILVKKLGIKRLTIIYTSDLIFELIKDSCMLNTFYSKLSDANINTGIEENEYFTTMCPEHLGGVESICKNIKADKDGIIEALSFYDGRKIHLHRDSNTKTVKLGRNIYYWSLKKFVQIKESSIINEVDFDTFNNEAIEANIIHNSYIMDSMVMDNNLEPMSLFNNPNNSIIKLSTKKGVYYWVKNDQISFIVTNPVSCIKSEDVIVFLSSEFCDVNITKQKIIEIINKDELWLDKVTQKRTYNNSIEIEKSRLNFISGDLFDILSKARDLKGSKVIMHCTPSDDEALKGFSYEMAKDYNTYEGLKAGDITVGKCFIQELRGLNVLSLITKRQADDVTLYDDVEKCMKSAIRVCKLFNIDEVYCPMICSDLDPTLVESLIRCNLVENGVTVNVCLLSDVLILGRNLSRNTNAELAVSLKMSKRNMPDNLIGDDELFN